MIEFNKKNIRTWSLLGPSGAHGAGAIELAKQNPKVLMLTSDLCFFSGLERFRSLYPEKQDYSWWSYRFQAREKNIGWRIDYFVVSNDIMKNVKDSKIFMDQLGSDHAPVCLEIDF